MRVAIVPVVAFSDLPGTAGLHVHNPQMCEPIVEPAAVVKFVRAVLVMAYIAAVFALWTAVAWSSAAYDYEAIAVRRPLKTADTILQIRDASRFAPIH